MAYLHFQDVLPHRHAFDLSNRIWDLVLTWKYFERSTLGSQLVEAMDSVSANIAEGFGRFGKKDKIKFYRYALGSVAEALDWVEKAHIRKLITTDQYRQFAPMLRSLPREIYMLIKITNEKLPA